MDILNDGKSMAKTIKKWKRKNRSTPFAGSLKSPEWQQGFLRW
jgi:hypothetical protein